MFKRFQTFTRVLYDLATHPEYVQPMRDEVQTVLREDGWSKDAVGKLYKLDSFIKESLRTAELGLCMCQIDCAIAYLLPPRSCDDPQINEGLHVLRWHNDSCW